MTTATAPWIASEVAERSRQLIAEADILLREITQAGRRPTYPELTYFAREVGWDERKVNDQLRRMHNVLRQEAIAGTPAGRQASAKEAKMAAALFASEGPKLEEQIQKLQAKRDELERDARLSQKRVEEQSEAVQRLRELCPEHIAVAVRVDLENIAATIGREFLDAETRLNELQCCLTPGKYPDEERYLQTLQRSFRDAVTVITEGRIHRRKLSPEWPAIKAAIQSEAAELTSRIEALRVQRAEAVEQAEKPLNYYADGAQDQV